MLSGLQRLWDIMEVSESYRHFSLISIPGLACAPCSSLTPQNTRAPLNTCAGADLPLSHSNSSAVSCPKPISHVSVPLTCPQNHLAAEQLLELSLAKGSPSALPAKRPVTGRQSSVFMPTYFPTQDLACF